MEQIRNIVRDRNSNVRIYLLKKIGYKGKYKAVIFPNELDSKVKEIYAENYDNFCKNREIKEYDAVHSEKGTIKKLLLSDLLYWDGMKESIVEADRENMLLSKENFTDDYSVIVLVYEKITSGDLQQVYLISQYRKVDSWYKRSIKFGFVANTIAYKNEEIFVLNGCIDTAIINEDVFILQENNFEKIFNYYEKSKEIIKAKKYEIEKWGFLDDPKSFYSSIEGKKGATIKLARALEKAIGDFSTLEPSKVRATLSQYDDFQNIDFDDKDRIKFTPEVRDIIIDIVRHTYTRFLFDEVLIHTKGV